MADFAANPKIELKVECHDKDGNLLWTDGTVIQLEEKEPEDGECSDDRRQE